MNRVREVKEVRRRDMKEQLQVKLRSGAIGWGLLWLIGVPIPVLLVLFLIRGCT